MKRLSLIHREGVSTSKSSTGGIAFAGGHVGVAHGASRGSHQTLLSKQFAPPLRKSVVWPIVGMAFFGLSLFGIVMATLTSSTTSRSDGATNVMAVMALMYGVPLFLCVRAYRARTRFNVDQPRLLRQWENSYMCGRCGDVFVATPVV